MPINKARNFSDAFIPFTWRLPNGIKIASDDELESSGDACERLSWVCGGAVVLGVLAEVAIAWFHPPYDSFWEQWGSVIANAVVMLGVAGEVQFSRMAFRRDKELKLRSDEKVAEANERAAEALQKAEEEQHARIKIEQEIAPRRLTAEQEEILTGELQGRIEPIYINSVAGAEARQYAWSFLSVLMGAGLVESDGPLSGIVQSPPELGMTGIHVFICSNENSVSLAENGKIMQSDPLVVALGLAGIKIERISIGPRLSAGSLYRPHWKDGRRVLIIAEKPPSVA